MSLLIKALEKAEQGKAVDDELALSLQPFAPASDPAAEYVNEASTVVQQSAGKQSAGKSSSQSSQQAAAGIFNAKNKHGKQAASTKVLLVAAAILLVLIVIGVQFYRYLNALNTPEILMARPSVAMPERPAQAVNGVQAPAMAVVSTADSNVEATASTSATGLSPASAVAEKVSSDKVSVINPNISAVTDRNVTGSKLNGSSVNRSLAADQFGLGVRPSARQALESGHLNQANADGNDKATAARSRQYSFGEDVNTSNAPVKISRNLPTSGINPNVLAGYQAFNQGDDVGAQRNYRQVLQGDVRNVDALLGMAAIAARQGRSNDALGWYGKVLELEPRNPVAQAAMVNLLAQADPVSSESRIKSLIAQQPEAAHLHAALGNLYAAQNQWPAAQQAYFQAYHFDVNNAEYAFNLAVSLEQLGKAALALPYYERVLNLMNGNLMNADVPHKTVTNSDISKVNTISGTNSIDRAQLEARIRQLQ